MNLERWSISGAAFMNAPRSSSCARGATNAMRRSQPGELSGVPAVHQEVLRFFLPPVADSSARSRSL